MTQQNKTKLLEVVRTALEKDDYYMYGRIGRFLIGMMETEDKLQSIIRTDDVEETELFLSPPTMQELTNIEKIGITFAFLGIVFGLMGIFINNF